LSTSSRTMAVAAALALLAGACGGAGGLSVDPLDDPGDEDVLSSCEPDGEQETTTLVEASGQRPSVADMEEAVGDHPDLDFMLEQLEDDGASYEDALHQMYAQVVGHDLFDDAQELPGFVTGAYARPESDEPFQLSFTGPVPDELNPDDYDLASFGLEVTTGATPLDQEAMAAAFDAAQEAGMRTVGGWGDETTGTGRVEVIDATAEQVAAWEQALDEPSRWCLVRAERSVPCDRSVIDEARQQADQQGEVLPNEQGDEGPTERRADEVRRSYLGLTLDEAERKAAREGRTVRVTVEDGVALGATDDLQPGRLSLTVCDGIVVDTLMDLEPGP
jgi:hypothetical protein